MNFNPFFNLNPCGYRKRSRELKKKERKKIMRYQDFYFKNSAGKPVQAKS